jgi:GDSL-like Lipase/Acylhydrolase family
MAMRRFVQLVLLTALIGLTIIVLTKVIPGQFGVLSKMAAGLLVALVLFCAGSLRLLATRWQDAVVNTWLVIASGFATYLVCDLSLGWLLNPRQTFPGAPDPVVHHRMLPEARWEMIKPDFRVPFTTNNVGLRGPKLDPHKSDDLCRILVLGDSFTFGVGVRNDQTFSALLERALNKRASFKVEVLNAGVNSYAPILEYLFFKTHGVLWNPDVVVLAFDMSDLEQEQYYRTRARFDGSGSPLAVDGLEDYRATRCTLAAWIRNHLFVGSWLLRLSLRQHVGTVAPTLDDVVTQGNIRVLQHTLEGDREDRTAAWRNVFQSIGLVNQMAKAKGIAFVLLTYPWGHQVGEHEWTIGRQEFLPQGSVTSDRSVEKLRRFAESEGVPFLDLFPAFRRYSAGEKLFWDVDMHWTASGHALAAEQLLRFLEKGPLAQGAGHDSFACCSSRVMSAAQDPALKRDAQLLRHGGE